MIPLPPTCTHTDTPFPYTTLFRSPQSTLQRGHRRSLRYGGDLLDRRKLFPAAGAAGRPRQRRGRARGPRGYSAIGRPADPDRLGSDPHVIQGGKRLGEGGAVSLRSEEHTSELQSLMRISYAVFWLK